MFHKSLEITGATPCMILWVMLNSLYSIRDCTRNQWRWRKTGEMSFWGKILGTQVMRSVVELLGCSAQYQIISGSSPGLTWSLYLHIFTSAARLVYQRPSGVWNACVSCTQKTPWDHLKRVGNQPGPGLPIWMKSESLGLNRSDTYNINKRTQKTRLRSTDNDKQSIRLRYTINVQLILINKTFCSLPCH
jgi:hypothetical protein